MNDRGGEWLSAKALMETTGIGAVTLARWRSWGLFPKGARTFHGRPKGTGAFLYPPIAAEMIRVLRALPRLDRGVDAGFWALWLGGYPIDIGQWAAHRLAATQKKAEKIAASDIHFLSAKVARQPAGRTGDLRPLWRHLQEREGRRHLLDWAVAVGIGVEPAISLYDPKSPSASSLGKAIGEKVIGIKGIEGQEIPDCNLELESMSLVRLRDILDKATPAHLDQARSDCKTFADLIRMAEAIDWQKARAALDLPRQGTSEGRRGPIAPFERLVTLWRNYDARAAILPYLIFVRGLPGYQHELDERLTAYAVELQCLAEAAPRSKPHATTTPSAPPKRRF
jgi:hypothetical protein